jgi:plasmid stabilization system protein ParE
MNFKIIVEPEAQLDIENFFQYYKNKATLHIAKLFVKNIQASYKKLKINPFYEVKTKQYRAYPLKKFPFLIFFEVFEDSKTIKIISVFNTEQHQQKYPK